MPTKRKQPARKATRAKAPKKTQTDPCWDGYHQVGTKIKGGKRVPNCVPDTKKAK